MRNFYTPKKPAERMLTRARSIKSKYWEASERAPTRRYFSQLGRRMLAKELIKCCINEPAIQKIILRRNESLIKQLKLHSQGKAFEAEKPSHTAEKIANYLIGKCGGDIKAATKSLEEIEKYANKVLLDTDKKGHAAAAIDARAKRLGNLDAQSYANDLSHSINSTAGGTISALLMLAEEKIKAKTPKE